MRVVFVALLTALSVGAGCADVPVEDTGADIVESDRPIPIRVPLTLSPCVIVEAIGSASESAVTAHLPTAFAPILKADGTVTVIFGVARCEGDGGTRAFVAMPVEPTDDRLLDENVSRHFFEPEHDVVRSGGFAQAIEEAKATPTWISAYDMRVDPVTVTATVTAEGFTHTMDATGPSVTPYDTPATTFREWFPGDGGFAYIDAHFGGGPDEQSGTVAARLTLGDGTIARNLLGAEATLQAVRLDPGHYNDAVVGFVPYRGP